VLNIDADEEVSSELRAQVQEILRQDAAGGLNIDGFYLSRVVFFLGKWWRKGGWYPEYRLRLVRKSKAAWSGEDPHEKALVDGPTAKLNGELRHYTYSNIEDQISSLNSLTSTSAQTLYKKNPLPSRQTAFKVMLHPLGRFFRFYVLRKGFLEGFPGLIVAVQEAYSAFVKYAKYWELLQRK
jgi:hypothetical protein